MSPLPPTPPDTHNHAEALQHGYWGDRCDPLPDQLY